MNGAEKPSRGIIMTGESVRAILAGRKTQMRRPMKVQAIPDTTGQWSFCVSSTERKDQDKWAYRVVDPSGNHYTERGREREVVSLKSPYAVGDLLYVKETWGQSGLNRVEYKAHPADGTDFRCVDRWRYPIYLPCKFARIHLEVTGVRAEGLQTITEGDAIAEGVADTCTLVSLETGELVAKGHRGGYANIWGQIHGVGSWAQNPWVFVYTFRRV